MSSMKMALGFSIKLCISSFVFVFLWFPPSYRPETRDLCILSGKNPLMMQKMSF